MKKGEIIEREIINAEPTVTMLKSDYEEMKRLFTQNLNENDEIKIIINGGVTHLFINGVDVSETISSIKYTQDEKGSQELVIVKYLL